MLLSMVHRKTWVITKLDQAGNGTQRIASCLEDMVKNVKSVLPSNTFVVLSDAHPSCKKKKKKKPGDSVVVSDWHLLSVCQLRDAGRSLIFGSRFNEST